MLAAPQTGGGTGLEIPLAGDGFQAIGSPINQRRDRGAACHEERGLSGKNRGFVPRPDSGPALALDGKRMPSRAQTVSTRRIRPCPCPVRHIFGFVAFGPPVASYNRGDVVVCLEGSPPTYIRRSTAYGASS